ncbi:MAG: UMP kinase, partial [Candidatus Pacebacteria bacterium CG_4_9_14_0_2_um_filter_36_8]
QVMDTSALAMSQENNLAVMIFKLFEGDNLEKAVDGENIGTYVSNDVTTKLV